MWFRVGGICNKVYLGEIEHMVRFFFQEISGPQITRLIMLPCNRFLPVTSRIFILFRYTTNRITKFHTAFWNCTMTLWNVRSSLPFHLLCYWNFLKCRLDKVFFREQRVEFFMVALQGVKDKCGTCKNTFWCVKLIANDLACSEKISTNWQFGLQKKFSERFFSKFHWATTFNYSVPKVWISKFIKSLIKS